jgi:hypothetical protein
VGDEQREIPRRRRGPRPAGATFRTSVRILGEAQIETFRAMCAIEGRRPHELAYDIVLEAIRAGQENHQVQELVEAVRAYQASERAKNEIRRRRPGRAGLYLVYDGPDSRMGRREMRALTEPPEEP